MRIVDLCPECAAGHLDLSQQVFAHAVQRADLPRGVVPITWQVVSPALSNPIAKPEYLNAGSQWVSVPRTSYNYFVQTNPGMGPGPYAFRVADSGIPFKENGAVSGIGQFPPGP